MLEADGAANLVRILVLLKIWEVSAFDLEFSRAVHTAG
jgi:hypothetical protein